MKWKGEEVGMVEIIGKWSVGFEFKRDCGFVWDRGEGNKAWRFCYMNGFFFEWFLIG